MNKYKVFIIAHKFNKKMASQDSLTEYKTILENETQEIVHDFEVFIKSATFLSEFPKLKTFLRLIPIDQNKWTEIYPDEDLDLTQLSGFQFIFSHKNFILVIKLSLVFINIQDAKCRVKVF